MDNPWRIGLVLGLMMLVAAACSDPPTTPPVSNNPCGDLCPAEQCMFGTCIDDGDAGTPDPNPDTGEDEVEDEPDPPKDCELDTDCEDDEFCFVPNENADGVCQEGCREDGCPEGEVCDLETHECVDEPEPACTEDGDCDEGEICDIEEGADEGECVEGCRDDDGCTGDAFCDIPEGADFGACVEGCRDDTECPEGTICNEETHECEGTPCTEDSECGDGEFCNEEGFCAPGCVDSDDCGENLECVDNVCVGENCDDDEDCIDGQICDDESGFCIEGCREDDDCTPGEICLENVCTEGCRDNDDCEAGLYCEEETTACEEGCRDDTECDPGNSCLPVDIGEGVLRQRCTPTPCTVDVDCDLEVEEGEVQPFYCDIADEEDEGVCDEGCRVGGCPEGLFCNEETRECEVAPCEDSDDCPEGEYCDQEQDPTICVPGCDDDAQCPNEQPCDLNTNTCGCGEDADCPGEQICSLGVCIPRCDEDSDCPNGFFCEDDTGLCIEGCRDDNLEPNNTTETAVPIDQGQQQMRMCYSARIGVDDQDCFSVQLIEDDTLDVDLTFSHDDGDLDLRLFDPNLTIVGLSDTEDDNEALSFEVLEEGLYVFCVEPIGGAFESDYTIDVTITPGQGCIDDAGEADGNDTCEEVQEDQIDLAVGVEVIVAERTICEGDEDFFTVDMRAGQELNATLSRTEGDEDLDIQIIDTDCQTVVGVSQDVGPVRPITFRAPSDGTYAVRVFGELPEFEGTYDLSLTLEAGDAECPADTIEDLPIEPNDVVGQATILNSFGLQRDQNFDLDGNNVCAEDEDWYRILIEVPSDIIRVTLRQSTADVPLRVEIRDLDGETVLDSAEDNSPSKTAESLGLPEAGSYFIRVSPTAVVPETGVSYSLTVLVTAANACIPDEFEPNNVRQAASLISTGTFQATMCRDIQDEKDFYRLLLGVGDRVNVTVDYDHEILSYMPTILYGPNGEFDIRDFTMQQGDTNTDVFFGGEFLVAPSDVGEWIIEVDAAGQGESLDYAITVDVVSPSCEEGDIVEDFDEPNDNCGQSSDLEPFTELNGFICGPTQDVDFFGVDVAQGQRLIIDMEYFHFDGNLDLDVFEPDGVTLAGFSHQVGPNFEEVTIENTVSGRYCVRVFSNSTLTQNDYSIEAIIQ